MKTFPAVAAFALVCLVRLASSNLRCYSCYPCNELEFFAGDVRHFEADCYLDRYCMKVSGSTVDIFGYRSEISIRGCPWISLLGTLEEGCTQSAISVAGAGVIEGTVCLCRDHLCNGSATVFSSAEAVKFFAVAIMAAVAGGRRRA